MAGWLLVNCWRLVGRDGQVRKMDEGRSVNGYDSWILLVYMNGIG